MVSVEGQNKGTPIRKQKIIPKAGTDAGLKLDMNWVHYK